MGIGILCLLGVFLAAKLAGAAAGVTVKTYKTVTQPIQKDQPNDNGQEGEEK